MAWIVEGGAAAIVPRLLLAAAFSPTNRGVLNALLRHRLPFFELVCQ